MTKLHQIPQAELLANRWYVGRGRNANVALWTGTTFVTIGRTFRCPSLKDEGYYGPVNGCFQPFALIDEGLVIQPISEEGDSVRPLGLAHSHYALIMTFPVTFPANQI